MAAYIQRRESDDDIRSRLAMMVEPGQQDWDLSPNDVTAIRWAIERIETLEKTRDAILLHFERMK